MHPSDLLIELPRLPKGRSPFTSNGTPSEAYELSSDDMDHLERIEQKLDQVGSLRTDVAALSTKVDGFTDLITKTVTHEIESMKHSQSKQGERIGTLETYRSIQEDRDTRSKFVRGAVMTLVTTVAGAALLKAFGLL